MRNKINRYFNHLLQLQLNTRVTDIDGYPIPLDEGFKKYIRCVKAMRYHTKIMFIGNGGSAAISSHMAIDYMKNSHLLAMAFNDASALTCLSNDYGYEHVFAKQVEFHARKSDLLVAMSSSGKSINILNAVASARKIGCLITTFSAFNPNNPLAKLGDINFYVDSNEYGLAEVTHLSLNHALLDAIVEKQIDQSDHQILTLTEDV